MLGLEYLVIGFAVLVFSDIISTPQPPEQSGEATYEDQDVITE